MIRDLSFVIVNWVGCVGIVVELWGRDNFIIEDDCKLILWVYFRI